MATDPLCVVGEVDADRDPKVRGLIRGQRLLAFGELVAPDAPPARCTWHTYCAIVDLPCPGTPSINGCRDVARAAWRRVAFTR